MQNFTQKNLSEGIQLTCITTDNFQTSAFGAAFVLPLQKENAAYAILPYLLYCGTQRYPDAMTLGAALDDLYGARIEPYVRKIGENLVLGFVADAIDAACIPDGGQFATQMVMLLADLMCRPKLENGQFAHDDFVREQKNLIERIRSLKNNPRTYAVRRAQEIMCDQEPFGACEYGSLEGAQALTQQQVQQAYQDICQQGKIELFYCGSTDAQTIAQAYQENLVLPKNPSRYQPENDVCRTKCTVRTVTEEMPVTQGKLTLGLRTGVTGADEEYPALLLFNAVLGGYTGSRLFCHVREKLSLCYYASSGVDKVKGLMIISSGIENEKYAQALTEIQRQFEDLCNGGLTQDELEQARRTVCNTIRSMNDSPLSLERFWQHQAILGTTQTPAQLLEAVQQVERGQVMAAGRHIDFDLIYFMKGADS